MSLVPRHSRAARLLDSMMAQHMNLKQRIVLLISSLLFVALGVYPPWHSKGSSIPTFLPMQAKDGTVEKDPGIAAEEYDRSLGYSLIFRPPQRESQIDTSRLCVEWLSLIAFTGSLILILGKQPRQNEMRH